MAAMKMVVTNKPVRSIAEPPTNIPATPIASASGRADVARELDKRQVCRADRLCQRLSKTALISIFYRHCFAMNLM